MIKHAHHEFDVDVPGKDSWVHRQSGAVEVLVSSARRWALMHELRGAEEPTLPELLAKMSLGRSGDRRGIQMRAASKNRDSSRGQRTSRRCFPAMPGSSALPAIQHWKRALPVAHLDDIPAIAAHDPRRLRSASDAVPDPEPRHAA